MRNPYVVSHWHKIYGNFFTSPLDFYAMVEQAIAQWDLPDIRISRVTWKEGGLLSDKREYLRVNRGRLNVDICAAPYGTGFFFSSWSSVLPPIVEIILYLSLLLLLFLGFEWIAVKAIGYARGLPFGLIMFGGTVFMLGAFVREGIMGSEEIVLSLPLLGRLYERLLLPPTFYREDTTAMFREAVHSAVLEVVETVTVPKGIRALSEAERRPVMRRPGRLAGP
jgi:hypothetical protein